MEHAPKSVSQTSAEKFSQAVHQEVAHTSSYQFKDARPEASAQRNMQSLADHAATNNSAVQLKTPIGNAENPIQKKNTTGMPDRLKSGVENLSGIDMSDVKVHYNSSQPAQLNAHAYAQGTNIHIAPGQEKHLPHEAWHVVQQKQGRVKPTMYMKKGVAVNDDNGLEKEADVMGAEAMHNKNTMRTDTKSSLDAGSIIQRYTDEAGGLKLSNNARFAVTGGTEDSALYVAAGVALPALQHIRFEHKDETINRGGHDLHRVTAAFEDKEEMENMFCGKFSQATTGITENVENENAPPGRSLFVNNPSAGLDGAWRNHFAPVILTDGTDRGTVETAVRINHIWFGIYGSERGHTFRFKTAVASTKLLMTEERGQHDRLMALLERYAAEGDASLEHVDEGTKVEIRKIAAAIETRLEPDGKIPQPTELTRARQVREASEAEELRVRQEIIVTNIRKNTGGWELLVPKQNAFTFGRVLREAIGKGGEATEVERLKTALGLLPNTRGIGSAPQSSSNTNPSHIVGGLIALAAIVALFAYLLSN